jgi:triosephosphate isomerase
MSRIPLIAGNWKMNKNTYEASVLSQNIISYLDYETEKIEAVLCPPFTDLRTVRTVLEFDRTFVTLGAQDVYWEKNGAYTGAISPALLKELDCRYCIVGHSERREYFGETDLDVSKKAQALLEAGITPIICVGEGLEKRDEGAEAALTFVTAQVEGALQLISISDVPKLVIAYEPIWAIGTGRTATPEQAQAMSAGIRAYIADAHGPAAAEKVRVLYGGSMKPENVALFAPLPDVDGGLIGGAALEARSFVDIVKAFA